MKIFNQNVGGGGLSANVVLNCAFTLAEMMVVMLIMSIVLACMAPAITTRMKVDRDRALANTSPWNWAQNNTDAYFGLNALQTAMIGQDTKGVGEDAKLIIHNNDASVRDMILFKHNSNTLGRLRLDANSLLLGSLSAGTDLGTNTVAFGRNVTASGNNSVVINGRASANDTTAINGRASGALSVAIGRSSEAEGDNSIAIGSEAHAEEDNSIAIGNTVYTFNNTEAIAMGSKVYTYSQDTIALGNNIRAGKGIVIGSNHETTGEKVIMIGSDSNLEGFHYFADDGIYIGNNISPGGGASILIGAEASSSYNGYEVPVIAIGRGANVDSEGAIAIGANTYAGSHSISIGSGATSNTGTGGDQYGIAIGASATNTSPYAITIGDNAKGSGITIGLMAESNGSIAIGQYAKANGFNSTAIGDSAMASGKGSVAFVATAKGTTSMALNRATTNEDAENSTAIGFGAETFAKFSSALGTYSKAKGVRSIAMGYYAEASGDDSVAIGLNAKAPDKYSIVLGSDPFTVSVPGTLKLSKSPVVSSDRRLKNVGKEFTSGLDKIKQVKSFNYTFKKDETKTPRVGVIAQDLMKVFPDAVKKGADGFFTIRMEDMFFAVINAVKELDARVTKLEKENKELKARLEKLEAKLK